MSNWLGVSIDYTKVQDKVASNGDFEILPQGWYKATIKNAVIGVIGKNELPCLTVHFELDEEQKEIAANYLIPQQGDSEKAIEFKKENLKNLFTRSALSNLSKEDYKNLSPDNINKEVQSLQNSPKGTNALIGIKTQIKVVQEPFISIKDGELQFTEHSSTVDMPAQLLRVLKKQEEESETQFFNIPVFMFSNKVAAHGLDFIADYEEKERKNSKAYEWVQNLNSKPVEKSSNTIINF